MDKLLEQAFALVSNGLVALLVWWLTNRSRDRQDDGYRAAGGEVGGVQSGRPGGHGTAAVAA
ncbi:hypothetical protein ABZW38_32815 [Streptomyces bacillaris]|uniref:hypothetical protein n=1 Tax=Streptomyces bacillaris TaxID=68179 RepID=UPI0034610633